jgi:hypothetical protein
MRPSASQLLQHERLDLFFKISETDKLLATVQAHKATLATQERALQARETALSTLLAQKDAEIGSLTSQLASHRAHVRAREEELRTRVAQREEEVALAMRRREEEILRAVRKREAELARAWEEREEELKERIQWVSKREEELREREREVEKLWNEAVDSGKGAACSSPFSKFPPSHVVMQGGQRCHWKTSRISLPLPLSPHLPLPPSSKRPSIHVPRVLHSNLARPP